VNWTTSEPATGQIEVGTGGPCPCPFRSVRTPGLTLPHSIAVAGLEPNTRYFFRVLSADAAGNLTATQGGTFTTPDLKVTVGEISGNVESRDSLGRLLSLSRGVTLPAGALIQTKSSSEAKDVTTPDGGRFQLASETRATIGPPGNSPGGQFSAQLVEGAVTFQSQALTARTERVRTDNVTIQSGDGECAGTASSSRDGNTVTTVVDVQTGQCEVRDKQGRIDQVSEGERRTYQDLVPKVSLLLPAHLDHMKRTSLGTARTKNPVVWTTLAGAAGYVIEWAVLPTQGFTTPNARAIERPANTLWLVRGPGGMTVRLGESPATAVLGPQLEEIISYTESNGNAQMDVALDAPSGVQLVWRVFPLDPSGAIMPNTDASDARIFTIEDELDNR